MYQIFDVCSMIYGIASVDAAVWKRKDWPACSSFTELLLTSIGDLLRVRNRQV